MVWGLLFGSQTAQNAVDEARRGITAKFFGQFNGFVNGYFWRRVRFMEQLIDGNAQNVSVYGRNLVDGPFRRQLGDDYIQFSLPGCYALPQAVGKATALGQQPLILCLRVKCLIKRMAGIVQFVKAWAEIIESR